MYTRLLSMTFAALALFCGCTLAQGKAEQSDAQLVITVDLSQDQNQSDGGAARFRIRASFSRATQHSAASKSKRSLERTEGVFCFPPIKTTQSQARMEIVRGLEDRRILVQEDHGRLMLGKPVRDAALLRVDIASFNRESGQGKMSVLCVSQRAGAIDFRVKRGEVRFRLGQTVVLSDGAATGRAW